MEIQHSNNNKLSKKERKALSREEKTNKKEQSLRGQKTRKMLTTTLTVAGILGFGLFVWWAAQSPKIPEEDVVSKNGIHWHSKLAIEVGGVKQDIPKDIGIGATHNPIHTHETDGTIHMEFENGLVKKSDIELEKFFRVWEKNKESFGVLKEMKVNGAVVPFEGYVMQDKDTIEMRYE